MRELRFRAWVYYGERLEKPNYSRDYDSLDRFFEDHDENDTDQCIEQYTGLKDKNGKEIYEGDILQDESNDTAVVIWREHHAEWGIKWIHMGIEDSLSHRIEWGHLNEIIGNIHENHELLE